MKFIVYILSKVLSGKFYIGSTVDFERRLKQHKRGDHAYSKKLKDFTLVFQQEFESLREARKVKII